MYDSGFILSSLWNAVSYCRGDVVKRVRISSFYQSETPAGPEQRLFDTACNVYNTAADLTVSSHLAFFHRPSSAPLPATSQSRP